MICLALMCLSLYTRSSYTFHLRDNMYIVNFQNRTYASPATRREYSALVAMHDCKEVPSDLGLAVLFKLVPLAIEETKLIEMHNRSMLVSLGKKWYTFINNTLTEMEGAEAYATVLIAIKSSYITN